MQYFIVSLSRKHAAVQLRRPIWRGGNLKAKHGGRQFERSSAIWYGLSGGCGRNVSLEQRIIPTQSGLKHPYTSRWPGAEQGRRAAGPAPLRAEKRPNITRSHEALDIGASIPIALPEKPNKTRYFSFVII